MIRRPALGLLPAAKQSRSEAGRGKVGGVTADRLQQAHDRIEDAVFAAVKEPDREPLPDWRRSLEEVAYELNHIANNGYAHPDDVDRARAAMRSLASVWIDDLEPLYIDLYPELRES